MPAPVPSYSYKATVVRWVDGDTVWLTIDLGFRMTTATDFRLLGVDTPEHGARNFKKAVDFVNKVAPVGTEVLANTTKPDKYGRWLVDIIVPGQKESISAQLITANLAKPYFGGTKS